MILSAKQEKAIQIMNKNYIDRKLITVISGYAGT